jgi:phosphomevalonate kinase
MELAMKIPGKAMLSGEFAVLFGGTAIMMPVPRYLKITEIDIVPDKPYTPVIQLALRHPIPEIADHEKEHGRSHVVIDAGDFLTMNSGGLPLKLGLGLSAAEATAVTAFRFEKAGKPWSQNKAAVFGHAYKIHSLAQQGLGSGADVACCSFAQPLRYKLNKSKPWFEVIDKNKIVYSIPMTLVWTGQSSNTRQLITKFSTWALSKDEKSKKLLTDLINASDRLADTWFIAPNVEFYKILDEFTEIMDECARQSEISYRLPVHDELDKWAREHGGRAKPTGAGGGDMILLIGDLPTEKLDKLVIPLNTAQVFWE